MHHEISCVPAHMLPSQTNNHGTMEKALFISLCGDSLEHSGSYVKSGGIKGFDQT